MVREAAARTAACVPVVNLWWELAVVTTGASIDMIPDTASVLRAALAQSASCTAWWCTTWWWPHTLTLSCTVVARPPDSPWCSDSETWAAELLKPSSACRVHMLVLLTKHAQATVATITATLAEPQRHALIKLACVGAVVACMFSG